MDPRSSYLPEIIASLNGASFLCLMAGLVAVKRGKLLLHRRLMTLAFGFSTFFLAVYLIHHYQVGSVPYGRQDWTRTLYFAVLIPHILLAVVMLPLILLAFRYALKNDLDRHRKIVRFTFPIWAYVSFTGLVVYYMLYRL